MLKVISLLVATLSLTSGFKLEKPKVAIKSKALGLQLRGGGPDMVELAKYAVYGVSSFMFIPAGRDVVAPGACTRIDLRRR